jgi:hypothetical protein
MEEMAARHIIWTVQLMGEMVGTTILAQIVVMVGMAARQLLGDRQMVEMEVMVMRVTAFAERMVETVVKL